ncbi:hypothetical protein QBC44DRAFT_375453 [Cladorrhinum sp. PSN332]|nr:hypothetical protein QBC44DRAFT_375453 [Cladorrhinum sp. PSN332]
MPPFKFLQGLTGWRRVAVINTVILFAVAFIFIGFLGAAYRASDSSKRCLAFFTGGCDTVSRLDIGLQVSKWETAARLVLLTLSIPIHLLFNSAIFATDTRSGLTWEQRRRVSGTP